MENSAEINGTMMYTMAIINKPLHHFQFNDLIGPTRPMSPKPAESGVPLILNNPPTNPDTPAVQTMGSIIIDDESASASLILLLQAYRNRNTGFIYAPTTDCKHNCTLLDQ